MQPSYWYPLSLPTYGKDEINAVTRVLSSGRTTMGAHVEAFEKSFARRVGARHAVMCNSGSSADLLIAFALDIKGEVLVPAVTWPTHVWSWQMAGARVRLVDVQGLNVTARALAEARTPQTQAVSLVHLMGVPCDMDQILRACQGLVLTEDCCEALGATYSGQSVGTFGLASAWSFFFSHQLSTMEGGMVTTNDAQLASRLRTLRSHGWARHLPDYGPYEFIDWGFNLRPTEVQGALGTAGLKKLEPHLSMRRVNYQRFRHLVSTNPGVKMFHPPTQAKASWFGIPLLVEDPEGLAKYLEGEGVETRPILAGNLVRQQAGAKRGLEGLFHGADLIHKQGLYLGLHPTPDPDVSKVATLVNRYFE